MISVLVPIYATNAIQLDYLDECLASVVDQTDDVVVWDDGSEIDIGSVVRAYPKSVTCYYAEHRGKSFSRNGAVDNAKYDLILPLDADDWFVPGALEVMYKTYMAKEMPVYSDIYKVHAGGLKEIKTLLDFDCDTNLQKCVASVSVLHTKEQWRVVGGWDEEYNLYEDWLYNGKLMWMYGGHKIAKPLLCYRQHDLQSTAMSDIGRLHDARVRVRYELEQYAKGELEMACCGKRRASPASKLGAAATAATRMAAVQSVVSTTLTVDMSVEVDDLSGLGDPGPGNVWALYIGGRGMGPHNRRGMLSRRRYQRLSYGDRIAAKAEDVVSREAFEKGAKNCGFVKLEQAPRPALVRPVGQPPAAPVRKPDSTPRTPANVDRTPARSADIEATIQGVSSMQVKELSDWLKTVDLNQEELALMMAAERSGSNRIGAIKLLERYLNSIM